MWFYLVYFEPFMLAKVRISYRPNSYMVLLDDRKDNDAVLLSLRKFFWPLPTSMKSECMAAWLLANQIHKVWKGRGHKIFVLENPHLNLNFYYVSLRGAFIWPRILRLPSNFLVWILSEWLSTWYLICFVNVYNLWMLFKKRMSSKIFLFR